MTKRKSTETLIEELARAVKRGFDEVATKKDLEGLATKQQFELLSDGLDLVRADVHDIKVTLGPLVRHVAATEERLSHLEKRVDRVERKVGLPK